MTELPGDPVPGERDSEEEQDPGEPDPAELPAAGRAPGRPDRPAAPVQSREDTDIGWGERPETDDDIERYYRNRPPHWDSA